MARAAANVWLEVGLEVLGVQGVRPLLADTLDVGEGGARIEGASHLRIGSGELNCPATAVVGRLW